MASFNNGGRGRHICIRLAILHRINEQRASASQFGGSSISEKALFLSHTCGISIDLHSRSIACEGTCENRTNQEVDSS